MAQEVILQGVSLGPKLRPDLNGAVEVAFDVPAERVPTSGLHTTLYVTVATAAKMPGMGEEVDIIIRPRRK